MAETLKRRNGRDGKYFVRIRQASEDRRLLENKRKLIQLVFATSESVLVVCGWRVKQCELPLMSVLRDDVSGSMQDVFFFKRRPAQTTNHFISLIICLGICEHTEYFAYDLF